MSTNQTGAIIVAARIENIFDLHEVNFGVIAADQARFVEVEDALVDTSETRLALPKRLIDQLGLSRIQGRRDPEVGEIRPNGSTKQSDSRSKDMIVSPMSRNFPTTAPRGSVV